MTLQLLPIVFILANSFLSKIRILKTIYNHHCNGHSNYEFSLVCKVHDSKEELQSSEQIMDSSFKFSLVCNRSRLFSLKPSSRKVFMC